jgi:predicted ATPase/DNA-binding winged helix-turn-helix (wHTH) protein
MMRDNLSLTEIGIGSGVDSNSTGSAHASVRFGPFELSAAERLLRCDGNPVQLGGRALDILIVLVARAGEVIGKVALMEAVWPDTRVEETTLRFHVAALRRALGDGQNDARYVANVPSRGYCFVATVTRTPIRYRTEAEGTEKSHGFPLRLARILGRDVDIETVEALLLRERLVTITGSGGIGKTTVAIAIVHRLRNRFGPAVRFVDLSSIVEAAQLPGQIATALGLVESSADALQTLETFFKQGDFLLLLDNCEQIVADVAALCERLHLICPRLHLLLTSREPLRIASEYIWALPTLAVPSEATTFSAQDALSFPAIALFVEHARASGADIALSNEDAMRLASICRQLDGIPLALKLAASRARAFGLDEMLRQLSDRFHLPTATQRGPLTRHRTLEAALDWSFALLSPMEQRFLSRLSVFVGSFTLEAAVAVVTDPPDQNVDVILVVGELVSKSLLVAEPTRSGTRYRLLTTTGKYLRGRLSGFGLLEETARRHSEYLVDTLTNLAVASDAYLRGPNLLDHGYLLEDVRAALDWSFIRAHDRATGIQLAAAAAPLFLDLSLFTECGLWAERALAMLAPDLRGGPVELELYTCQALAQLFTEACSDVVQAAFARAMEIAEQRGDLHQQLRLLSGLHICVLRDGDYRGALAIAHRIRNVASLLRDPVAEVMAAYIIGVVKHLVGDQTGARADCEAALASGSAYPLHNVSQFGVDHRVRAECALARSLWMLGFPEQAMSATARAIADAHTLDHPPTLAIAIIWSTPIYFWAGELAAAARAIDALVKHTETHTLDPYRSLALGLQGKLQVAAGRPALGVPLLRAGLADLQARQYHMLIPAMSADLAEALITLGQPEEALDLATRVIAPLDLRADLALMPELLRIKGIALAALPSPDLRQAEANLRAAIILARKQSARSWELRALTSLASLFGNDDVRAELAALLSNLTEGHETADLLAARCVLGVDDAAANMPAGMSNLWRRPSPKLGDVSTCTGASDVRPGTPSEHI